MTDIEKEAALDERRLRDPRFQGRRRPRKPFLRISSILAWADAHFVKTGRWPHHHSGVVAAAPWETWLAISTALNKGMRGLPGGSSLARLLAKHRGVRNKSGLPAFSIAGVLAWADDYRARTGKWPTLRSGPIAQSPGDTWSIVNSALVEGSRGLAPGMSVTALLVQHRGLRNRMHLSPLTHKQILAWADQHRRRTGRWPVAYSGTIPESPGETWKAINSALHGGTRGLPGKESLARLLVRGRGVKNWRIPKRKRVLTARPPGPRGGPLSIDHILGWARMHKKTTGLWPRQHSGKVLGAPGETWKKLDSALRFGSRGLPGGNSLAGLLERHHNVRNHLNLPHLAVDQILAWADQHFKKHRRWPNLASGSVAGSPGDTWFNVNAQLMHGGRGLRGGSSLAKLLATERGVRQRIKPPPLRIEEILRWADHHRMRAGRWPEMYSGPIGAARGESWAAIDCALKVGRRGLPGGSSLAILLHEKRGLSYHRKSVVATTSVFPSTRGRKGAKKGISRPVQLRGAHVRLGKLVEARHDHAGKKRAAGITAASRSSAIQDRD